MMNGIEKRVDGLGRIVIPFEMRRKLGIEEDQEVRVTLRRDTIVIQKVGPACPECGKTE